MPPEDAADIGEQVVAAATGVQQHVDPGISGLEPAELAGLGQQRLGPGRLGHQDMSVTDKLFGLGLIVGPKNVQMGKMGRLEQAFIVAVVLTQQQQGTLAHTLVPYRVYGKARGMLSPSYPS